MPKKGKKIILILVEGGSDLISLELIKKLNRHQEEIAFKITKGDITSNERTTLANCISKVNDKITEFIAESKVKKSDIIKLVHILDTDGTYISDDNIEIDTRATDFIYTDDKIIASSKDRVSERNAKKKSIMDKLLITAKISSIDYELYYMSCNLDHVLHNRRDILTDEAKKQFSNAFADEYYGREEEFLTFINDDSFKVSGSYQETWSFIKLNSNSLKRYSNLCLFFEKDEEHSE